MTWQNHPYILPCLLTAGVSGSMAWIAWKRRSAPGALPLSLLLFGVMEWSLGYALGLGSTSLPAKIFWAQVQYLGIAFIPILWLSFSLQFTGYSRLLSQRNLALLALVPLFTFILVWSNGAHGWIWSATTLVRRGELLSLRLAYGPWFWLHTAYSYIIFLAGFVLLVVDLIHRPLYYRGQSAIILLGALFPVAGNVIRLTGLSPFPDLDLTPFAFTLSGVLVTLGLSRYRLFDIIPVARSAVLDSMNEGVIVLDHQNRVVDLNRAATEFIHRSAEETIGKSLRSLLVDLGVPSDHFQGGDDAGREITLDHGQGSRVYDVLCTPLHDDQGLLKGRLVVLRDITERKRFEEQLHESEERFRQLSEAPFEAIVIHKNGVILDVNRQYLEILGYQNAEEVLGKDATGIIVPEELEKVRQHIASGYEQTYQTIAIKKDGTKIPIEVRGKKMSYQGQSVRVTALRDISELLKVDEKLRSRAEELTSLHKLSLDIIAPFELSTLLERIVERAVLLLGAGGGGLYLCDPRRREARCVVSYQTPKDYRGTVLKYGEGAAGIVAETGKPLLIDDYRTWQGRAHIYDEEQPFRSVISVPLLWQNRVIGVIHVLQFEEGRTFSQENLELLSLFANQATIAIENADFVKEIQTNARRMALLNDLTQVAISAPNLESMLKRLVDRLAELFDASGVYLTLWDEERQVPIPRAAYGQVNESYTSYTVEPGEPTMTTAVLQAGHVLIVEDTAKTTYDSPRLASLFPARAIMGLPLIADGRKLGAAFIGYDQPRHFPPDEITLGNRPGRRWPWRLPKPSPWKPNSSGLKNCARSMRLSSSLPLPTT